MKFTESILERLDPRTKIISFLLIILCLILFPVKSVKDYGLFFLLILVIALLSMVTPKQILKKLILLIPFILFITMLIPFFKEGHTYWSIKIGKLELDIAYEGIQTFIKIFIKSSLSILLIVIASFTITFSYFDILFLYSIIIFLMFIVSGLFHKMGYLNINNPNIWQAL